MNVGLTDNFETLKRQQDPDANCHESNNKGHNMTLSKKSEIRG